ncbi:MAG: Glycerol kinase, partial [uncultured Acidimicrobiales bacterium]
GRGDRRRRRDDGGPLLRRRRGRKARWVVVPGVRPALPPPRVGRARRRRDLVGGADDAGRAGRHPGPTGGCPRHHRPARDGGGLGPADWPPPAPGDRVAGPPHGGPLRGARGGWPPAPGQVPHRARPRPVLQRHQGGVARRRGRRGGRRAPRPRHRRHVAPLAADRWGHVRDGRLQRQQDVAARHRHPLVVRRALRPVPRAPLGAGRGATVQRALRRHRRGGRGACRDPGERDRRRPAGGPVRPGVHRPWHDEEHLRHRQLRPHERGGRRARTGPRPPHHGGVEPQRVRRHLRAGGLDLRHRRRRAVVARRPGAHRGRSRERGARRLRRRHRRCLRGARLHGAGQPVVGPVRTRRRPRHHARDDGRPPGPGHPRVDRLPDPGRRRGHERGVGAPDHVVAGGRRSLGQRPAPPAPGRPAAGPRRPPGRPGDDGARGGLAGGPGGGRVVEPGRRRSAVGARPPVRTGGPRRRRRPRLAGLASRRRPHPGLGDL